MLVIEKLEAFKPACFELWLWKDDSLSKDSKKCYLKELKTAKMRIKYTPYLAFPIEFLIFQKPVGLQSIFQGNIQVLQQRFQHLRTGRALDSSRV